MKKQRGKKSKYLIRSKSGLLENCIWQLSLQDYNTSLISLIRNELLNRIPGITESFNTNSRYFGYWIGEDKDRLYIYVQKKHLRIDLCIDNRHEKEIVKDGFEVVFANNFQGRDDWVTGWRVPHNTKNIEAVLKWLCYAFEKSKTNN